MIKILSIKNKEEILEFCYERERENLFAIGSFSNYEHPFSRVKYYGCFDEGKMVGLATYYIRHKNLVINAAQGEVIDELVDFAIKDKIEVEFVANFEKYALPTIKRLKDKHGITAKKISYETVYVLSKEEFKDFSEGDEEIGTAKDIDEIVRVQNGDEKKEITDKERAKIIPNQEFILRKEGKIVSKANIHGVSKHYFQIGGVGTRKEFRGKGYAKQVVSNLCKTYFNEGKNFALLFTDNENNSAIAVYKKLGFKPVDKFIIARYR